MTDVVQRLSAKLFADKSENIVTNLKIFLGDHRHITAEQIAVEVDRAESQLKNGVIQPSKKLDGHLTTTNI